MMSTWVSQKDVAKQAGVSSMTVSRALRDDPRVLPETKKLVLETADALGYRADPTLRQMMGYMRHSRIGRRQEVIALVWPDLNQETTSSLPQLQRMVRGARERAEQSGFGLDEHWLEGSGITQARLCSILRARGVQCVILAPLLTRAHGQLTLEWNRYSIVATGLGLWQPRLHRVHFDHYGSMLITLRALANDKSRRIALVVDQVISERMHHAWSAAFLANHPLGCEEAVKLLMVAIKPSPSDILDFLEKSRAEVLIAGMDNHEWWMDNLHLPTHIQYVTLGYSARHPECAGIDQRDDLLGAYAVDMVVAQFNRREYGIPPHPKVMLNPGDWREATQGAGNSDRAISEIRTASIIPRK